MVSTPKKPEIDGIDTTLGYLKNIEEIIFGDNGKNGMLAIEITVALNLARALNDKKQQPFFADLDKIMETFNLVGDDFNSLRELIDFTLEAPDGYSSGPGLIELERNYINCCNSLKSSIDKAYDEAANIFKKYGISNLHYRFKNARPTLDDSVDSIKELGSNYLFNTDASSESDRQEFREGTNTN